MAPAFLEYQLSVLYKEKMLYKYTAGDVPSAFQDIPQELRVSVMFQPRATLCSRQFSFGLSFGAEVFGASSMSRRTDERGRNCVYRQDRQP